MSSFRPSPFIGASPEDDPALRNQARVWSWIVNGLAMGLMVWLICAPTPVQLPVWIAMAFPIGIMFLMRRYDGILKFSTRRGSREPDCALGAILPALGLWMRTMIDWSVATWGHFWLPFMIVSGVMGALAFGIVPEVRRSNGTAVALGICLVGYAYGAVLNVNGMLATSPVVRYKARIESKYVTQGRHGDSYFFSLSPWGPREIPEDVHVSETEYASHGINDTVTVTMRDGCLGIPNFWVQ